jgi:hypothetical protein
MAKEKLSDKSLDATPKGSAATPASLMSVRREAPPTVQLNVGVTAEEKATIKRIAAEDGLNLRELVVLAVAEYDKRRKNR